MRAADSSQSHQWRGWGMLPLLQHSEHSPWPKQAPKCSSGKHHRPGTWTEHPWACELSELWMSSFFFQPFKPGMILLTTYFPKLPIILPHFPSCYSVSPFRIQIRMSISLYASYIIRARNAWMSANKARATVQFMQSTPHQRPSVPAAACFCRSWFNTFVPSAPLFCAKVMGITWWQICRMFFFKTCENSMDGSSIAKFCIQFATIWIQAGYPVHTRKCLLVEAMFHHWKHQLRVSQIIYKKYLQ